MRKIFGSFLTIFSAGLFLASQAQAVAPCAVCVVAIGSGLGISRALGIDDSLTGIWIGALLLAIAMFTTNWMKSKWPNFKWSSVIGFGSTYLFTIPFFFVFDLFSKGGEMFGVSRLLIGMISGTVFLTFGLYTDKALRQLKEDGKAFFPFQKVLVPVAFLLLATAMMAIVCA